MTAATGKPDAFGFLLCTLQALYEDEIHRLVDVYRPRILAGEFSGEEPDGNGVKFQRLERELRKTHPWLATERGRIVVLGASRWLADEQNELSDGLPDEYADECMAHDIMQIAAARRWAGSYDDLYAAQEARS